MRRQPARRSTPLAIAAAVLLCAMTACSEGTTSTSGPASPSSSSSSGITTTTGAGAACTDAAALKSSLEQLTAIEPLQAGTDALKGAIADAKTSLQTTATSASAALQPGIEQVRTAFAELETAASGLSSENLREKVPSIKAALRQVGAATSALGGTLAQACPGS